MRARNFKVMELPERFGTPAKSHVRFRGHWLKACGFVPGVQFTVECPQAGTLVLRIRQPERAPDPAFNDALTNFVKLGI